MTKVIYFSWFACFLKELKTAEQQINVLNVKLFSVFLFQLFFSMFHGFIEHLREETGRERRRGGRRAGHRSDSNHRVSAARTQRSRSGSVQPPIEALKIRTGPKVMARSQTLHFWSKFNVIFHGLWYFPTLLTVSERSTFYYYHL